MLSILVGDYTLALQGKGDENHTVFMFLIGENRKNLRKI
jgi:hypothetical protein